MDDLVSVIIPIYNVEMYVEKCIRSIVNQTYKNLEIIVVNDGTKDRSMEKIKNYIEDDKRIKVINQENRGVSAARNKGIEYAAGEYISFIDSDDFIDRTMIEKMYKKIKEDNSDIVMCNIHRIDYEKNKEIPFYENYEGEKEHFNNDEAIRALLLNEINGYSYNKLYKRSLFKDVRYKEGILFEDIFVTFDTIKLASKVSVIKEKLYFYTLRKGSITTSMNKKSIIDLNSRIPYIEERIDCSRFYKEFNRFYFFIYLMSLDWIMNYRHKNKISDEELGKIIRQNEDFKGKDIMSNQYVTFKEKIKYVLMRMHLLNLVYTLKYIIA